MSDPAVEAAKRATNAPDDFPFPSGPTEAFALTAAREALKPVREKCEQLKATAALAPYGNPYLLAVLDVFAPLIYSTEELER